MVILLISSSPHPLSRKSMAIVLMLALTALLPYDVMAASGGAMGGGFSSSGGVSRGSSSGSRSRHDHYYSTRSTTTYLYRDSCYSFRQNHTPLRQIGMMEAKGMDTFFYSLLGFGLLFALVFMALAFFDTYKSKMSIVKLQVALKGAACSLQQDLNRIALKADTSTQEGYKYVLEESAMALLRHSETWQFSYLSEKTGSDKYQAERLFYDLSFQERSKFDEETLVNLDNHQEQKSNWEMVSTSASPFIVVNLLVATVRELKLSPIHTASDLKATLMALGGLAKSEILAVHVLWTPQDENDHLSAERLHQDYPLLMDLRSKSD